MTILVPFDGSSQSEYALQFAAARFAHHDVTLLHVLEPTLDEESDYHDQITEDAQALLDEAVDSVPDDVACETAIRYGRPVDEITAHAEEGEVGQTVIGSHGRQGIERLLLGSVAEGVVRRSTVPVTVVRQEPADTDGPGHVLVPFDGSESATAALSFALDEYPDAEITVLYVRYPSRDITPSGGNVSPRVVEDASERLEKEAEEILDDAESVAADANRSVRIESEEGRPADAIIAFASNEGVDQIVMGSQGRDGLNRLLLGSVAETVMRRAETSVTVVR